MKVRNLLLLAGIGVMTLISGSTLAQTIYVVPGGSGTKDGSSWTNAMASITDASLTGAHWEGRDVWVAKGTYEITYGITPKGGMNIYGGFEGTETALADRPAKNKSKLIFKDKGNVILNGSAQMPAVFDGFELTGMNSTALTVLDVYSARTVSNCLIHDNNSSVGVSLSGAGAIMYNCAIWNNTATTNGAVVFRADGGEMINCTVVNNSSSVHAGGVYFYAGAKAKSIKNCIIWGNTNTGTTSKPIFAAGDNSTYEVVNCAVQTNTNPNFVIEDDVNGNMILSNDNSDANGPNFVNPDIQNYHLAKTSRCLNAGDKDYVAGVLTDVEGNNRIIDNKVDMGAYEGGYDPIVIGDVFYITPTGTGDGASWASAGNLENVLGKLAAGCNKDIWVAAGEYQLTKTLNVPTTVNMYGGFAGNETELSQRDLTKKSTLKGGTWITMVDLKGESDAAKSTVIDGFAFTGQNNSISGDGMYGVVMAWKNRNINNCIAYGNTYYKTAGFYVENATISNSLIYGNNTTAYNAPVHLSGTSVMINCTVTGNTGARGGLRVSAASKVCNSIIWNNIYKVDSNTLNGSDVIGYMDGDAAELVNCAVPEIAVYDNKQPKATNIFSIPAAGPGFVDAENSNFALAQGSVCIDKGDNTLASAYDKDILGNKRISNNTIDLGAYEYSTSSGSDMNYSDKMNVSVYPNPVNDIFTIVRADVLRVSIYDISGALLFSEKVATNGQVNIAGLSSGFYNLIIYTADGSELCTKIIKK